jgi:(p)ppGpp synthase/HD superfamily hydrolase
MQLSERFEDALAYAARLHAAQVRKASGIPYISHLLAVTSIALEYGADEDEAIAALLHDAIEDQGGQPIRAEIERRYGVRVAAIVEGCSDTDVFPKPPWRQRKEAYLAHLRTAPAPVRLISAADKLANARSVLMDYRQIGEQVWERFNGGKDGTLWNYRALVEAFRAAGTSPLVEELARTVEEMEHLAAGNYRDPSLRSG